MHGFSRPLMRTMNASLSTDAGEICIVYASFSYGRVVRCGAFSREYNVETASESESDSSTGQQQRSSGPTEL